MSKRADELVAGDAFYTLGAKWTVKGMPALTCGETRVAIETVEGANLSVMAYTVYRLAVVP